MKIKHKKRYLQLLIVLVISILLVLTWLGYQHVEQGKIPSNAIHIAFIGPMSVAGATEGKSFTQGINLYLDSINQKGGINGKKIVLDVFDDKNNPEVAKAEALRIVNENQALAVIGHFYSSCSLKGGEVYKQYEIPAITPGSTNVEVTRNNPWYFRTVFNDNLQGRFLANYLKKVLRQNTVTIIHEDQAYGAYLAKVFDETARELDIEIKHEYVFEAKSKELEQSLKTIVDDLQTRNDIGFIFVAAQAVEGAKIIQLIKDAGIENQIIVPAALASKTFQDSFKQYPKEKMNPGYYTNGIYITTPLIFDTANEKAQQFVENYREKYQEEADLRAAFGYDTVMVIVEAIKNAAVAGEPQTVAEDRQKIRNYLASLNDGSNAIEGVTGLNYFDEHGDAQKPVAIGMFKNENIISALVQLQDIRNPSEIANLDVALNEGRVLLIDGKYMYKTNVVYVGVKINEISDFDPKDLTFAFDFYIWFRFQGDINPQNIDFLNAIEPIQLQSPIVIETVEQMSRHLYRVENHFKADFLSTQFSFKQHVLGIKFRHRDLIRKNLIYVTDILGMKGEKESWVEKFKKDKIFSSTGWKIEQAWFFQNILSENALGSLKYLNVRGGTVEYSQFNLGILIGNTEFTLRRTLSASLANIVAGLSSVLIAILALGFKHPRFQHFSKLIWLLQTLLAFILLFTAEVSLVNYFIRQDNIPMLDLIIESFDILWWVIPAVLLHLAVELFLWKPLEEKSGRNVPRIGRRFIAFTIYLMAFFAIVAFVYDQRLTSLLATSGVIAMIIGLAIQINISNIFSGIAINIEHPFRVGDWVQIGNFEEGKVVDITWRTTRIMTRMGCILCIPNSVASESTIHNFDYPDSTFWLRFIIHIHPSHPPDRVRKIIRDAVISTEVVLKTPEPFIIFRGLSEWAADYLVYFVVKDYAWRLLHEESVWTRIWIHLNRAGIAPAVQRQEIHLFKGVKERGEEAATNPLTLLQEIDIFRPFSKEAKAYLSKHMHGHRLPANEIIVRQGEAGNSLFILVEGVVGVRVSSKEGEQIEVARLGAGNFFGEMALLTGEERTATVISLTDTFLFEITKADIAPLIAKQPEVSELVSKVLTQRQMMTQSQIHVQQDLKIEEEAVYKKFLSKIENFFGLGV